MKKICLAVVICMSVIGECRADLTGTFLRMECNKDLGLLELEVNYIRGDKIGQYFNKDKPVYQYSIDTEGESKSHTEIVLISYMQNYNFPYIYQCQLSEHLSYQVQVDAGWGCEEYNDAVFSVSVKEQTGKQRALFDKLLLGCGSLWNGVRIADNNEEGKKAGADVTVLERVFGAFITDNEIIKPLTSEDLKYIYNDQRAPIEKSVL